MKATLPFAAPAAVLALLLAACSSTPTQNTSATATPTTAPPATVAGRQAATPPQATPQAAPRPAAPAVTALPAHLDPASALARERSVYFEFDEAIVKPDGVPVIERQGQYLSRHPELTVRVEGNTDERGGSEYNLALGQRRAEAVKKSLRVYGVKDGQVEAVSFGKERPQAPGHDETAWAQNRRADVVYAAH